MKTAIIVGLMPLLAWNIVDHVSCSRALGYDENCDLTASVVHAWLGTSEQTATCDTKKGLFCLPYFNKCGCYVPTAIFVDGACRAKVNHPCLGNAVLIDCVENAKCTEETFNYCKCIENHSVNDEETACVPTRTKEDILDHQSNENENAEESLSEVGDSRYRDSNSNSNNYSSRNRFSVVLLLLSLCIFYVKYF